MTSTKKMQKSYFDVLGLCCSSEIPLIEKLLKPLDGVKEVSVIVASRTVIVVHNNLVITQLEIVNTLNQARLEANVRVYGEANLSNKWPSPYAVACGVLLLLSFLKYFYHPFQWLALVAVAAGILPILLKGIAALRNYTIDTNILLLIAVGGSITLHDYWEAGSVVFLFTIAQWLESRACHKTTAVMSSLMNMVPQKAILAETGEEIDASEVMLNTVLAVKPGENVPIDGIVVDGKCEVDEKTLTGESFPVSKQTDSIVWAGTLNLNGYISVKTTAIADDCVVAKMAKLVEEAQNNKSKTQRFIDKCAKYYTPAIVVISIGLAAIPAILKVHNQEYYFHLALVVLVSACPCALVLSTPVATFCALSTAATSGLLIKGGDYLETLSKIKIIGFDKTGTITRGEFMVTEFQALLEGVGINTLVYWVSSIESKSSHPMAAALIDYGQSLSIEPKPENVEEFENFPGEGIYGKIDGKNIYVGNRKIASRAGCETDSSLGGTIGKGRSIGYIFLGGTNVGVFSLSDTCRTGAKEAINELKSMGIKTVMLTGDSNEAAAVAQNQLEGAFELVHAELLPQDKANIIKHFQEQAPTTMVGDGLNDAPALATADIGISMGISGSALAKDTGNVILMSNDIRKVPQVVKLARRTQTKVVQNVFISILTKTAILGLAFGGYPLVWAAVLADVGTCLFVIFNSMLLLKGKKEPAKHCHESSWKTCFLRRVSNSHSEHSSHSHEHNHVHQCTGHSHGHVKSSSPNQTNGSRPYCTGHSHEHKHCASGANLEPEHGHNHHHCTGHSHEPKHCALRANLEPKHEHSHELKDHHRTGHGHERKHCASGADSEPKNEHSHEPKDHHCTRYSHERDYCVSRENLVPKHEHHVPIGEEDAVDHVSTNNYCHTKHCNLKHEEHHGIDDEVVGSNRTTSIGKHKPRCSDSSDGRAKGSKSDERNGCCTHVDYLQEMTHSSIHDSKKSRGCCEEKNQVEEVKHIHHNKKQCNGKQGHEEAAHVLVENHNHCVTTSEEGHSKHISSNGNCQSTRCSEKHEENQFASLECSSQHETGACGAIHESCSGNVDKRRSNRCRNFRDDCCNGNMGISGSVGGLSEIVVE